MLLGIVLVLSLLCICIAVDSADNTTVTNINKTTKFDPANQTNITFVNGTAYVLQKEAGKAVSDGKLHVDKSETPTVSITAKPSCGCRHGYYWHTRSFVDYCPHCHRYGVLRNVHKYQARYEQELTCTHCGADYCGVCGKEKYSWSRYYLKKA